MRALQPRMCRPAAEVEQDEIGCRGPDIDAGGQDVGQLRPARRKVRRLASKLNAWARLAIANVRVLGARLSSAYIEDRMLRAVLEVELYRGRYRHSNKNDDDYS